MRRVVAATLVALFLMAPASALAAGASPFSPGLPLPPQTVPTQTVTTPVVTTTTSTSGTGLSGAASLTIAFAGIGLIAGITWWIWRLSRRDAAAIRAANAGSIDHGHPGSKAAAKPRKLSPAERKRRKRGRAR